MDPNHFDYLVKSLVRRESRIADVAHRRELSAKEGLLDSLPVVAGREAVPRRSVLKVVSALAAGGLLPLLGSPR